MDPAIAPLTHPRRLWRRVSLAVLLFLAVLVALAAAIAWQLQPENLKQRLEVQLSAQAGRPVHLGSLQYTWRDEVTLTLRDVALPPTPTTSYALRIGSLQLRTGMPLVPAVRAAWAMWHGAPMELSGMELQEVEWQGVAEHSVSAASGSVSPVTTAPAAWRLRRLLVLGLRKAPAPEEKVSATAVEAQLGVATIRLANPAWTPTVTQFVVQVVPVNLRELLPPLGVAVPPTRSPQAFSRVGLQGACRVTPQVWSCGTLQLQLDGTHLEGSITREWSAMAGPAALAANAAASTWHFTLHADRLNLDDYLPPDNPREPPFQVPWEMANAWPVVGTLKVDELQMAGLRMKDAALQIHFGADGLVVQ